MRDLVELLHYAMSSSASDLYVTATKLPSMRLHGQVHPDGDEVITAEQVNEFRLRLLGEKGEKDYRAQGSFDIAFADGEDRFRMNFLETMHGPGFVARPIHSGGELDFGKLGLPASVLSEMCNHNNGIIIVVGATGSGKSTTLSAMVNHINRNFYKHIITIEDPIEYQHHDINSLVTQRELNGSTSSFTEALRGALRESPDVIVIGEMRDMSTVQVAITAAMTGHLVITTVHTSDTVQAVERVIDLYPEHLRLQVASDLGNSLVGIVAQRLAPRADHSGMVPALEVLVGTPAVRKLVAERNYKTLSETLKRGVRSGMVTFTRAAFNLFKEGLITQDTANSLVDNADELRLLMKGMESGVDSFQSQYGTMEDVGDPDAQYIDMSRLLRTAVKTKASDMILTAGVSPMLRIHGDLRPLELPELTGIDTQRLLYSVLTPAQKVSFEEQREVDLALSTTLVMDKKTGEKQSFRFRVNGFFQRGNVGVVARVIDTKIPSPEQLNIPPQVLQLGTKKQGLVLVTGPTGSGKTTTLASIIDLINKTMPKHIITVEDPIEYVHNSQMSVVEQREVHADTLSFANSLKFALRQNPDVILVGEMRDVETIGAAITAAETGHLVFGTLHTNSAAQTIDRIIDAFPAYQQNQIRLQLSASILSIISQRLLPKLDGKGRVAAFEILIGTSPVKSLIREGKTNMLQSTLETSTKDGMITMGKSLETLYNQGLVGIDVINSYTLESKK